MSDQKRQMTFGIPSVNIWRLGATFKQVMTAFSPVHINLMAPPIQFYDT